MTSRQQLYYQILKDFLSQPLTEDSRLHFTSASCAADMKFIRKMAANFNLDVGRQIDDTPTDSTHRKKSHLFVEPAFDEDLESIESYKENIHRTMELYDVAEIQDPEDKPAKEADSFSSAVHHDDFEEKKRRWKAQYYKVCTGIVLLNTW